MYARRHYRKPAGAVRTVRGRGAYSATGANSAPVTLTADALKVLLSGRKQAFMSPDRAERRMERRKRIGSTLKGALGSMGNLLTALPAAVTSSIPALTGLGAYKIKYNTIMAEADPGQVEAGYVPTVANRGSHRTVRIRHREYIGDVESTTGFANTSYAINPANSQTFPWLSAIAQNFQEYCFHGLVFSFVSTSADALNSTNTALGTVIMSTDYNAGNTPYASKQQAENSEFTVSCRPSVSMLHGVECDPAITINQGHLYVWPPNGVPNGQDVKTYNLGLFQFMTQGSQASATIGELWVSYDIELIKPIDNSQFNQTQADHFELTNVSPGGSSNNYYFGGPDDPPLPIVHGIGGTISQTSMVSTYKFPATAIPGQIFQFTYWLVGDSSVLSAPTLTLSHCTGNPIYYGAGTPDGVSSIFSGGTTTVFMGSWSVIIDSTAILGVQASISLSAGAVPGNSHGDLMVVAVPLNFTE